MRDKPTSEELERIVDAFWRSQQLNVAIDGVTFLQIDQHNVCNHTLSGTIESDGVTYGFIIDNGDHAGTVVQAWGDPEDVGLAPEPEPQPTRTFLPNKPDLFYERPKMWAIYLGWRQTEWFQDKERGYNYDRHFAPGSKTEGHYRDWAAAKGLRVGYLHDLSAEERASIAAADSRSGGAR